MNRFLILQTTNLLHCKSNIVKNMKRTTFLFFFVAICIIAPHFLQAGNARQMEYLNRGLVAVKVTNGVYLSWRMLATDSKNVGFNIYRNNTLINTLPITTSTNYSDASGTISSQYKVIPVIDGVEIAEDLQIVSPWAQQYKVIQLQRPAAGITPPNVTHDGTASGVAVNYPDGENYTYTPNDMSVADLDGDGEYELIVKWDPSNSKDNSQTGITGNVFLDAYKLDGTFLWRIDLGKNIRAGAHYTQFFVYDFDGDGKAELICKTAPGTIDGKGNYVIMNNDNPQADYRNLNISTSGNTRTGFILNGSEYLTLFDGLTGEELNSISYKPNRSGTWGDSYGNRVDRFLACVAYLDGVKPSAVMCRGYYTRSTMAAYQVVEKKLVEQWFYDSGTTAGVGAYAQGFHSLSVADVDGDGFDEIIYGAAVIDHDGKLLSRNGAGHGDALHVSDMDPDRPGLEVWSVHEDKNAAWGYQLYDPVTGQNIWGAKTGTDVGRGLAADIDPNHRGFEMWSSGISGVFNCKGVQIASSRPSVNFRIYWDGDLQDELLDGTAISKWNPSTSKTTNLLSPTGLSSCNSTKKTPNLSADILGDWREELILWETADPSKIRIYTTITPTQHRLYTLMHDPVYRMSIAWQNVAYNQPPHLGFYIGDGVNDIPWPEIVTPRYSNEQTSVDAPKAAKSILYKLDNKLVVQSSEMIESVCIYSVLGKLLCKKTQINNQEFNVELPLHENVLIVKVNTKSGTQSGKIMR